jgi:Zn-dependent peptidase ImmA (M78 family)
MHAKSAVLTAEAAARLRLQAGYGRQSPPAFSTKQIIRANYPDTLVTGGRLPDGVEAMVTRCDEGPLIVYQRSLPILQQRYAIAHEIGHLALGHLDLGDAYTRGQLESVSSDLELAADAFATELLAPIATVARFAKLRPSSDPHDHEIYLDHVDDLASMFMVPAVIIDSQIRKLVTHARLTYKIG